jgi:thermitase
LKKELISVLVITIIVASTLNFSLFVGFPGGNQLEMSPQNKNSEGYNNQALRSDDVGMGQLSNPDFSWAVTSGKGQMFDTHDPLLGWNSEDAGTWSNFAYVNGSNTRLILGVDSQKDPSFTQIGEMAAKYGGQIVDTIKMGQEVRALVIQLPLTSAESFAGNAYGLGFVRYVEPDVKIQAQYTPNDANWSLQWATRKIQADWAWNTTIGSSDILVAVVDSGIDYNHPDIAPNYILGGYDWVYNDTDPMDDDGHGTQCAGIIAAVTNNSIGIAGTAQVHIMAEKVIETSYGTFEFLAKGIIHATDCGAKIISLSLREWRTRSGLSYDSELVHDAVRYAYSHGVLIVAAAGNDNSSSKVYPAAYDEVVSVAATDQNDNKAGFSNWGEWIELAAPGEDIYSTVPGGYEYMNGTSMACAYVSGVAALVWSEYPNKSRDWVRMWLRYTADDLGVPGFDPYNGYGRVNARKAVEEAIPGHDIAVSYLESPKYAEPAVSQYINATVLNLGATNEKNIEIQFIANNTLTDTRQVSFLANGTSTTVSFNWTPTVLGKYNITICAEPVPGEGIATDNVISGWISVQYPMIRALPGQWANYMNTTPYNSVGMGSSSYSSTLYDHYVEPYVMYVVFIGGYPANWITVNTWDRRIESSEFLSYYLWFDGWIETNITMGSTVNLEDSDATVYASGNITIGTFSTTDCWTLRYVNPDLYINNYSYDKTSGLLTAVYIRYHGGYIANSRLIGTNIPILSDKLESERRVKTVIAVLIPTVLMVLALYIGVRAKTSEARKRATIRRHNRQNVSERRRATITSRNVLCSLPLGSS